MKTVNADLRRYIEQTILPQYAHFDPAHRMDHVQAVIERSAVLATLFDVNVDMVYTVAAYHDTGLGEGREHHHEVSARIIREDAVLRRFFTPEQIDLMADAAYDHRASLGHEPRTIYGKIVAEADRLIEPRTVIRRTVQYGVAHCPELSREEQYQRFVHHLQEKYSEQGYLRLWIPQSHNAARLKQLQAIIHDTTQLQALFDEEYDRIVSAVHTA